MPKDHSIFEDRSTLLTFAYSPAGFGHLRVTDALYRGLPPEATPLLLGSQDESIRFMHRFMSIHPSTRYVMEFLQRGWGEELFTRIFRFILRKRTKILYRQMITLLEEQYTPPTRLVVVATHFGLAHQFGALKKRLSDERKIRIDLIVQVTDDSPQKIWVVPEADLTVVPSETTRRELETYSKKSFGKPIDIIVNPYPVSPLFTSPLRHYEFRKRVAATDPSVQAPITVAIPISGAAVGMAYFTKVIDELHTKSSRFIFNIVAKVTPNTLYFLNQMIERPYVKVTMVATDREVVRTYEDLYAKSVVGFELTKPSEQAFKSLINPHDRGGSILLFCDPVGRQEDDNLAFLRRHELIPSSSDRDFLLSKFSGDKDLPEGEREVIAEHARHWRGLELPSDPEKAAEYIWWCHRQGIFKAMAHYTGPKVKNAQHKAELGSYGVVQFWTAVQKHLANP